MLLQTEVIKINKSLECHLLLHDFMIKKVHFYPEMLLGFSAEPKINPLLKIHAMKRFSSVLPALQNLEKLHFDVENSWFSFVLFQFVLSSQEADKTSKRASYTWSGVSRTSRNICKNSRFLCSRKAQSLDDQKHRKTKSCLNFVVDISNLS